MTDELKGYIGLDKDYNHLTVKHSAGQYFCPASGSTTNDMESVWALMKRGLKEFIITGLKSIFKDTLMNSLLGWIKEVVTLIL